MWNARVLTVAVVLSVQLSVGQSASIPHTVTADEAKSLILTALPSKAKHLPKFGLDGDIDPRSPRFYVFSADWDNPGGSVVYGTYAVDTLTGDVWDAVTSCDELSTPALRRLQVQVRSRIGLDNAKYRLIKSKGALC